MGIIITISLVAGLASRSYKREEGAGDLTTSRIALGGTPRQDTRDTPQVMVGMLRATVGMRLGTAGMHPGMADMGMGDTQVSPAACSVDFLESRIYVVLISHTLRVAFVM